MMKVKVRKLTECKVYCWDGSGKNGAAVVKPLKFLGHKLNKETKEILDVTHIQDGCKLWVETWGLRDLMVETNEDNIVEINYD